MLTTLIMLSIIAGLFIIASIVDRLLPHSILFPSTVTRAIKGQRDVSEYLASLAMLDRDGPYVLGHAFDDLMRGHIGNAQKGSLTQIWLRGSLDTVTIFVPTNQDKRQTAPPASLLDRF